jgi:predicted Rossmann fold flavoprotein
VLCGVFDIGSLCYESSMKIAIVGGGAAGLMAAATAYASNPDAEIFVLEQNDGLGKKVIISGGGRCNVTTGFEDVRTVLTRYPRGAKFLTTAMYAFPPMKVREWFESHGVPLKCEDDLRVFPVSDDGHDIVHVFEEMFSGGLRVSNDPSRVKVMLRTRVESIVRAADESGFVVRVKQTIPSVAVESRELEVDKVILTTGGQAYRHTGSTGDGYAFAISLGHSLTPLAPSLNAFFTREKWPAAISGLSFEKATITSKRGGVSKVPGVAKPISFTGPFLFTHRGVSGPAVFALSGLVAFERYDQIMPLDITIDLFPDVAMDVLLTRVQKVIAENPAKILQNIFGEFVPKSLAEVMMKVVDVPGDRRSIEVAKKDVQRAVQWLKGIPLSVIQRGAGDEFVTAGGILLSEVDQRTMESRICPGLYFAGEILDIDGFTGGFNLQASWATGHLAGESAAA